MPPAERLTRRGTDRVEDVAAWLIGAAALVLLVVAVVSGVAVHRAEEERALFETATQTPATAVVLEDMQVVPEGEESRSARVMASWTDADGTDFTGRITVRSTVWAGDQVGVWIDPAGRIAPPPAQPANAVVAGAMAFLGVLFVGGTALATVWYALRGVTGAYNSRRWEREWAQVGPVWSREVR